MFLVFDYVAPDMTLAQLPWHPRNTKLHYRNALFEDDSCPLKDLIQTVVTGSTVPKIPSQFVEKWLGKNTDTPSRDGIPRSGRLNEEFEARDDCDGDVADFQATAPSRPRIPRRQAPPDKVAADQLHWQITECLSKQNPVYKEYCEILKNFRDDLVRRGVFEQSGTGNRNRTQAFWERGSKKIGTVPRPPVDPPPVAKKARPSRVPGTAAPFTFSSGEMFNDG